MVEIQTRAKGVRIDGSWVCVELEDEREIRFPAEKKMVIRHPAPSANCRRKRPAGRCGHRSIHGGFTGAGAVGRLIAFEEKPPDEKSEYDKGNHHLGIGPVVNRLATHTVFVCRADAFMTVRAAGGLDGDIHPALRASFGF